MKIKEFQELRETVGLNILSDDECKNDQILFDAAEETREKLLDLLNSIEDIQFYDSKLPSDYLLFLFGECLQLD